MIKNLLTSLALCLASLSFAQIDYLKSIPENLPSKAPATIAVSDSFSIDKSPVTYLMYQQFLDHIRNYYSPELLMIVKEPLDVQEKFGFSNEEQRSRFYSKMLPPTLAATKPLFKDKGQAFSLANKIQSPLIDVNKEQASAYCAWRTYFVNLVQNKDDRYRNQPLVYKFTLASSNELASASSSIKKQIIVNENPLKMGSKELAKLQKKKDYLLFDKSNEISIQSDEDAVGIFRCSCEVNKED